MLFIFGKWNAKRNGKKWNETQNETVRNPKPFDIQGYVDSLKSNFDPSRARGCEFISYQLEQIDHHLGGLVDVIGVNSGDEWVYPLTYFTSR